MSAESEAIKHDILVVDDDSDGREALCDLLEMVGYRVECLRNGQEALNYLHEVSPHPRLILLDLYMPVMDGWEFMRRLHDDPTIADLPVVVLSALDRPYADHARTVLQKPVDVRLLMDTVTQIVGSNP
jgi:two-component system, chemotaxis family, chemotaxis protein CheY